MRNAAFCERKAAGAILTETQRGSYEKPPLATMVNPLPAHAGPSLNPYGKLVLAMSSTPGEITDHLDCTARRFAAQG
jgi:hypothetical protein